MRRKVVIILDDVVVALDLAQTLQDIDAAADVCTFRSPEAALAAMECGDPAALAVVQVALNAPVTADPSVPCYGLGAQCILLSDTAADLQDVGPNVVVLPRPFSSAMVARAVSMLAVAH